MTPLNWLALLGIAVTVDILYEQSKDLYLTNNCGVPIAVGTSRSLPAIDCPVF